MSGAEPRKVIGVMTGSREDIAELLADCNEAMLPGCKFEHLVAVNSTNRELYSDRGKSYIRAFPENDAWRRFSITLWREHDDRVRSGENVKRKNAP